MKIKLVKYIKAIVFYSISICSYSQNITNENVQFDNNIGVYLTIKGKVIDSLTKEGIPFLKINLTYDLPLKNTLTFLTNEKGEFEVKVPKENISFILQVNSKFFKESKFYYNNLLLNKSGTFNIGVIRLQPSIKEIDEVIVKEIRNKIDINKKTYYVSLVNSAIAPTANSFIQTIPGIHLNNNDYTLYNYKKAKYFLNGVESNKEVILNLPLEIVEKIEIVFNPPLSAELKDDEFIINLVTKKNFKYSFGGQLSDGIGLIRNTSEYKLSSYLSSKFLFINFTSTKYFNDYSADRNAIWKSFSTNILNFSTSDRENYSVSPMYNSLSVQYTPNKKFGFFVSLNYDKQNILFNNFSNVLSAQNDSSYFQNNTTKRTTSTYGNLTIRYKVKDNLVFYLLAGINCSKNNDYIENMYNYKTLYKIDSSVLNNSSHNSNNAIQFKNEFTLKNLTIESSILYQKYESNSIFGMIYSGTGIIFPNLLGFTSYKQNLISSSITLTKNFNIGTFMLGAKLDDVRYIVTSKIDSSYSSDSKILNFLPKFSFFKSTSKSGTFVFSYQKDFELPNSYQLSGAPVSYRPNQQSMGSARLQPEVTNSFTFYHIYERPKSYYNSTLYIIHTTDFISKGPYDFDSINFSNVYSNIGKKLKVGFDFSVNNNWSKAFSTISNVNMECLRFNLYDGVLKNNNFNSHIQNNNYFIKLSENITYNISNTTSVEFLFEFRNKNYDVFEVSTLTNPNMSLTLNKNLFKNKLFAKCEWNHIFNLDKRIKSSYSSPDIFASYFEITKFQDIHLSFVYFFGKSKKEEDDNLNKKVDGRNIKGLNF
ncbi:outer membrane beta-barrel protein [Hydrotalea flava]|uniref:outer membrane beta-barrel protein n=1 Tax=Hydrotalea flava TaxID=714549 RepID=UPI00142EC15C|nr:outer membrane beta-barrel protein [Hydrotalea flava]